MRPIDDKHTGLIGFDMDGILAEFFDPWIRFHNQRHGTSYKREDYVHYTEFWKSLGMTQEGCMQEAKIFFSSEAFYNLPPVNGSIEGIDRIIELGHRRVVITSRDEDRWGAITNRWINELMFPNRFEGIYHSNSWDSESIKSKSKGEICKNLMVDLMVEDCLRYAIECANAGVTTLLLDCPWNGQAEMNYLGVTSLPKEIIPVNGWEGIVQYVETDFLELLRRK